MQSERSYFKKKTTQKHKKQNKGRSDLFVLVAGFILTYSNPSVSRQQRGTLRDISGADTKSARTLRGRRVTREQQQLYKNNTTVTARVWRRQWSNGASAPKWRQTHLLCRFNQLQTFYSQSRQIQAYFRLQQSAPLQCGVPVKGGQHGPASSHTHTDTQRPLCRQQQQTHTVWSRSGLAPKNKTRGMFSLEVESCHFLRSGFVVGGTSAPLWNRHPYFLITSPQLKATIRKYFFPHSLFLFNHLFPL